MLFGEFTLMENALHSFLPNKFDIFLVEQSGILPKVNTVPWILPMEQHTFKNVNNCWNTNIYSYLETSGGKSFNLYLNLFNTCDNKTSVAA